MEAQQKATYARPVLSDIGPVGTVTLANSGGTKLDEGFPVGTDVQTIIDAVESGNLPTT
jgi:hypothetical protein